MQDGCAYVQVEGSAKFPLKLRIPSWSDTYKVLINGIQVCVESKNGYIILEEEWTKQTICLELDMSIKKHFLNGKIAFTKGAYVLSSDQRLCGKIKTFVAVEEVKEERVNNQDFYNNVTVRLEMGENSVTLCDYAQAGKNYDEKNSIISVWFDVKEE